VFLLGLTFLPWLTRKETRPAAEAIRSGLPTAALEHPALSMRNKYE